MIRTVLEKCSKEEARWKTVAEELPASLLRPALPTNQGDQRKARNHGPSGPNVRYAGINKL
jgi:hypothetical protein